MPTSHNLFVDTSGWGYLVDAKDPAHRGIEAIYKEALRQKRGLVTTNYIIAELVAVLESRNRVPRVSALQYIDRLKTTPAIEIIHVDESRDQQAWDLLKARTDKGWSLVDATSFVIMQQHGMTEALTTDHHFLQAGFVRLPQ